MGRVLLHTSAGELVVEVPEGDARWAVVVEEVQVRSSRRSLLVDAREHDERAQEEERADVARSLRERAERLRQHARTMTGMQVVSVVWSHEDAKRVAHVFRSPSLAVHIGRVVPDGIVSPSPRLPNTASSSVSASDVVARARRLLEEEHVALYQRLFLLTPDLLAEHFRLLDEAMWAVHAVERGETGETDLGLIMGRLASPVPHPGQEPEAVA